MIYKKLWTNWIGQIRLKKNELLPVILAASFAGFVNCAHGPRVNVCIPEIDEDSHVFTLECSSEKYGYTVPVEQAGGYRCLSRLDAEDDLANCKRRKPLRGTWCTVDISKMEFRCDDGVSLALREDFVCFSLAHYKRILRYCGQWHG